MKAYLFACIEKNIGDDLFVRTICNRYPNTKFIITSEANYGSLQNIHNLIFSDILSKWNWASSAGGNSKLKYLIAKILQKYYESKLPKYELGVYIVGNAFKNKKYTGWRQSRWMRERINLVDKFYILSTNFGPYQDEQWKYDFDKIFPQVKDVCFRDKYSYDLFSNLENIRYAPDAIFSIGQRRHITNKNVIISLIDCAFEARSIELQDSSVAYEEKMVEVIEKLLEKGYNITLLNSNTIQDRPACNRILRKLDNSQVSVVDYDGNLDLIFDLFENSSYIIGTRLHSIILGFLYNLNVLPIVYDIKVANMLDSCDFDQKKFDITNLDNIDSSEIVDALEHNSFIISEKVIEDANNQFLKLDTIMN